MKFRFRIEAIVVVVNPLEREKLRVRIPSPLSCVFSQRWGGVREEGLSVILPPQPGGEVRPGQAGTGWGRGRGALWRGAEAVGTATVPHVSLAHSPPPLVLTWGTREGETRKDFVLSGKLKVGAPP